MQNTKTVLCVEDNYDNGEMLEVLFELADFNVTTCTTGDECFSLIEKTEYSIIILDYHLPVSDGIEICTEIKKRNIDTPIVFFTADARETIRQAAFEAGADAFLIKPDDLDKVVPTVTALIEARN
jgi:CheY-like chemotaxis protein